MKLPVFLTTLAVSGLAMATTTLTDDAGRTVTLPEKVQRVVGGHDAMITLPLYELKFEVVGSHGRQAGENGWNLFGLKELFGVTPEQAGIVSVGNYDGTDLEQIKQLKPDLVVLAEGSEADAEMVQAIAPAFIQHSFSGDVIGNSSQRQMAQRFGADEALARLDQAYQQRLAEVKAKLPFDPKDKQVMAVLVFDQVNVLTGMSGLMQVLIDLGFQRPQWVEQNKGMTLALSGERIGDIDSDLVIVMPSYVAKDRSPEAIKAVMDQVVPGWHLAIKADDEGRLMYLDSLPVITPTFVAAHNALDAIEAHFSAH